MRKYILTNRTIFIIILKTFQALLYIELHFIIVFIVSIS